MGFKSYIFFKVVIIVICSGSSAPFMLHPLGEELNSKDARSSLLQPQEGSYQCAVLPEVDESIFKDLINVNCYVDKTAFLYKMIVMRRHRLWFLSRPRRFGKTLLLDTMETYFKGKKELFKGTYIYQHYLGNNWSEYPVIRLDFSYKIRSDSLESFEYSMLKKLKQVADLDNLEVDDKFVEIALGDLIEKLNKKYNKKVIVLIDEYDSPYTSCYTHNKDEATKILRILQSFFRTLKGAVKMVRFSMTTGITRLALSDFFSGANAAVDLTMDEEYANILGFTENELTKYFGGFIEKVATLRGSTTTEILDLMRKWHDGFRFTSKNESVYSPISTIGFLRSGGEKLKGYSATVDDSKFFIERLKQFPEQTLEIFLNDGITNQSDVLSGRIITAKEIELTGKINFDNSTSVVALTAFLFHSGYLRIKSFNNETESYTLEITNEELRENYAMNIYKSFTISSKEPTEFEAKTHSLVQDLDECRWKSFISKLNSLHSVISCFLLNNAQNLPEALFQISMYWIFHFSKYPGLGKPTMEDATNFGRSDILLPLRNKMCLFELKRFDNTENPVYQCKVKYARKHFFSAIEEVLCIGLTFNREGIIQDDSWGMAKFSKEGKLIEEAGNITLTNQLTPDEEQKIKTILTDFKKKHLNFTLQPNKLIKFLTDIGPTTDDERSFANSFTTDTQTLCTLLRKIKGELQFNLRTILNGFLHRNR